MPGKFFAPVATYARWSATPSPGRTPTPSSTTSPRVDGSLRRGLLGTGARFSVTFQRARPRRLPLHDPPVHGRSARRLRVPAARPHGPLSAGRTALLRGLAPTGVAAVTIEQRRADGTLGARDHRARGRRRLVPRARLPPGPAVYRASPRRPEPAAAAAGRRAARRRACARLNSGARDPRTAPRPGGPCRAPALLARALPLAPGRPHARRSPLAASFVVSRRAATPRDRAARGRQATGLVGPTRTSGPAGHAPVATARRAA